MSASSDKASDCFSVAFAVAMLCLQMYGTVREVWLLQGYASIMLDVQCRGLELAARGGDMLCEVHAAEGMLKVLQSGSLGRSLKNRRELKRSLQDKVQAIVKEVGEPVIESSCRMLSFAGL